MLPPAVLRQLYVQGSLTNTPEGAAFKLKNSLAPATVIGLEIAVDGQKIPPDKIYIIAAGQKRAASELASAGQKFNVRDEVTIVLGGVTLTPGAHKLDIKAKTKEWGELAFDVSDTPR
ncbi:hydroxymethylglutaryl-CoA reductase [Pyrobaculum aerophilum]|uniref:Hydroxymethylglutaryl-CoA reductase n=1 Tax=Pyrobaculum aerophilum TaxID=13773 RepID=A0A371R6V9_9CREN|nr:hydroxymethylglutaryl-CoA reductase [Pyrobaculum aerophilum]RFA94326.1 hydroxymethylglutaryl-CoA reductase [Pyrobaculum aerophilum]RFB00265.1 hydroxymethylglutaryl-CoA reductase [Pyrobaculum aerophilum]